MAGPAAGPRHPHRTGRREPAQAHAGPHSPTRRSLPRRPPWRRPVTDTITFADGSTVTVTEGFTVHMDGRHQVYRRGQWIDVADLESGRVRIGGPGDWFERITWSPGLWSQMRPPRFQRTI